MTIVKQRAKHRFNVAKLRARGYSSLYCDVQDESELAFLTKFEQEQYAVCKVTMDSFELVLREYEQQDSTKVMSKQQLIESFRSKKHLFDIESEESLVFQLMTHAVFQKDPDTVYLPYV